jgi:hypothetical protein
MTARNHYARKTLSIGYLRQGRGQLLRDNQRFGAGTACAGSWAMGLTVLFWHLVIDMILAAIRNLRGGPRVSRA